MGIRKLPFGYMVSFGNVVPSPPEAEKVRWIFEQYVCGLSYNKIVAELDKGSVRYDKGKLWNKNMVARVLADRRYLGQGFPKLIDEETFQKANNRRPQTGAAGDIGAIAKILRPYLRCATCGGRLTRKSNHIDWETWSCTACGGVSGKTGTPAISAAVADLINLLIRDPGRIAITNPATKDEVSRALEQELECSMENFGAEFDEDGVKALIFSLASKRLEQIGAQDYETQRLRRRFQQEANTSIAGLAAATSILEDTVERITVGANGKIQLILKNNQVLEKESFA